MAAFHTITEVCSMQTDLAILEDLNRKYIRAAETSDVRWYADNLAEDFLATNPDGSLIGRAAFVGQIARPCPVAKFAAEDVRWRSFGPSS